MANWQELEQQGDAFHVEGNANGAILCWTEALYATEEPTEPDQCVEEDARETIRLKLIHGHSRRADWEAVLKVSQAAAAKGSKSTKVLHWRALALGRLLRWDDAEKALADFVELGGSASQAACTRRSWEMARRSRQGAPKTSCASAAATSPLATMPRQAKPSGSTSPPEALRCPFSGSAGGSGRCPFSGSSGSCPPPSSDPLKIEPKAPVTVSEACGERHAEPETGARRCPFSGSSAGGSGRCPFSGSAGSYPPPSPVPVESEPAAQESDASRKRPAEPETGVSKKVALTLTWLLHVNLMAA